MTANVKTYDQADYPSQYETEVVLRDGSSMLVRPVKEGDAPRWLAFVKGLSRHVREQYLHQTASESDMDDAVRFCTVDYDSTFALVAEVLKEPDSAIVAIGKYFRLPRRQSAQVDLVVDDAYQGRGIGTGVLDLLARAARERDIASLEADVATGDEQSLGVFRSYGFHVTSEPGAGVYHITFPISRTPGLEEKEEERERVSALASLRFLIRPRSVALIGASRHPGTIGYLLLQCMTQSGFSGTIYPVNPHAETLMSLKAYASVLDISGDVDMAVIAVPAELVPKLADECGHKGVRMLVVISDGFREVGAEGASRERELRRIALGHGMRVVGPNCMGVINTALDVKLNATFSPVYPPPGNVAFLSQSGAMGLVILEYANNLNMGISTFLSVGNRLDVSSNDLLEYWEEDEPTDLIMLYLESFGNPRKFARIARRVSVRKPIVVVKGGSTQAGSRAASSHTGALATSDVASDALFHYAGIVRANTMEELFDVATLLSNQPLPRGRRLVIVTNGGGPGIIAADAAARHGLLLNPISQEMVGKLKSSIKREIPINNPLDTTAGAVAAEFHDILSLLAVDKDSDAVLVIFIPPVVADVSDMEEAIRSVAPVFWQHQKPLLACFLGQRGFKAKLGSSGKFVPCYPFPEEAILALSRAAEYAETRARPKGKVPHLKGVKRARAHRTIWKAMTRSPQRPLWLTTPEMSELLDCYGMRSVETVVASSPNAAASAASRIGFPVVVKLASSSIVHKSDVGGVVLDLNSPGEVRQAFQDIRSKLTKMGRAHEMEGVIVQKMVKEGIEAIAGVTQDPAFGPLMMFGSGGTYAELTKDVALRLHPLTDLDAKDMISSIKMARLFEGYRGSPPADTAALQDLLLRLSAMVEDVPQIAELDFNPVKVMPRGGGYWIVDSRIMIK